MKLLSSVGVAKYDGRCPKVGGVSIGDHVMNPTVSEVDKSQPMVVPLQVDV